MKPSIEHRGIRREYEVYIDDLGSSIRIPAVQYQFRIKDDSGNWTEWKEIPIIDDEGE